MEFRYKYFISILIVLCFTVAVWSRKTADELTPHEKSANYINFTFRVTRSTVKGRIGVSRCGCWKIFCNSLKAYADTRIAQLVTCDGIENKQKCYDAAVVGMDDDAKLAYASVDKCITSCPKKGLY